MSSSIIENAYRQRVRREIEAENTSAQISANVSLGNTLDTALDTEKQMKLRGSAAQKQADALLLSVEAEKEKQQANQKIAEQQTKDAYKQEIYLTLLREGDDSPEVAQGLGVSQSVLTKATAEIKRRKAAAAAARAAEAAREQPPKLTQEQYNELLVNQAVEAKKNRDIERELKKTGRTNLAEVDPQTTKRKMSPIEAYKYRSPAEQEKYYNELFETERKKEEEKAEEKDAGLRNNTVQKNSVKEKEKMADELGMTGTTRQRFIYETDIIDVATADVGYGEYTWIQNLVNIKNDVASSNEPLSEDKVQLLVTMRKCITDTETINYIDEVLATHYSRIADGELKTTVVEKQKEAITLRLAGDNRYVMAIEEYDILCHAIRLKTENGTSKEVEELRSKIESAQGEERSAEEKAAITLENANNQKECDLYFKSSFGILGKSNASEETLPTEDIKVNYKTYMDVFDKKLQNGEYSQQGYSAYLADKCEALDSIIYAIDVCIADGSQDKVVKLTKLRQEVEAEKERLSAELEKIQPVEQAYNNYLDSLMENFNVDEALEEQRGLLATKQEQAKTASGEQLEILNQEIEELTASITSLKEFKAEEEKRKKQEIAFEQMYGDVPMEEDRERAIKISGLKISPDTDTQTVKATMLNELNEINNQLILSDITDNTRTATEEKRNMAVELVKRKVKIQMGLFWLGETDGNVLNEAGYTKFIDKIRNDFMIDLKGIDRSQRFDSYTAYFLDFFDSIVSERDENRKSAETFRMGKKLYKNDFFGTYGANRTAGYLSVQESLAWAEVLSNPEDEEAKTYAQAMSYVVEKFNTKNKTAMETSHGWFADIFAKDFASNIGNQAYQLAVGGGVAIAGAAITSLIGMPWLGFKIGYVAGTARYSYRVAAGSAYKTAISMGVPHEFASAMAKDEAFLSSLIESVDAIGDVLMFSGNFIAATGIKLVGKTAAKAAGKAIAKVAKTAGLVAAKKTALTALKKTSIKAAKYVGKGLLKMSFNAILEGAEEGTQELLSIANEQRMQSGNYNFGKIGLAVDGIFVLSDVLTGADEESADRFWESVRGGMAVSLATGTLGVSKTIVVDSVKIGNGYSKLRVIGSRVADLEQANALVHYAAQNLKAGSVAQKAAVKLENLSKKGTDISKNHLEIGSIYSVIAGDVAEKEIRSRIQATGYKGNVSDATTAMLKYISGDEHLTKTEKRILKDEKIKKMLETADEWNGSILDMVEEKMESITAAPAEYKVNVSEDNQINKKTANTMLVWAVEKMRENKALMNHIIECFGGDAEAAQTWLDSLDEMSSEDDVGILSSDDIRGIDEESVDVAIQEIFDYMMQTAQQQGARPFTLTDDISLSAKRFLEDVKEYVNKVSENKEDEGQASESMTEQAENNSPAKLTSMAKSALERAMERKAEREARGEIRPKSQKIKSKKIDNYFTADKSRADLKKEIFAREDIPHERKKILVKIADSVADIFVEKGKITAEDLRAISNILYSDGDTLIDSTEYAKHLKEFFGGRVVYVDDDIRAEFGTEWEAFRKKAQRAGLFLTSEEIGQTVEDLIEEIKHNFNSVFEKTNTKVLEVDEIEESPIGSAMRTNQNDSPHSPKELSAITVSDLLELVKGDALESTDKKKDFLKKMVDSASVYTQAQQAAFDKKLSDAQMAVENEIMQLFMHFCEKAGIEIEGKVELAQYRADIAEKNRQRRLDKIFVERVKHCNNLFRKLKKEKRFINGLMGEDEKRVMNMMLETLDDIAIYAADALKYNKRVGMTYGEIAKYVLEIAEKNEKQTDNSAKIYISEDMKKLARRVEGIRFSDLKEENISAVNQLDIIADFMEELLKSVKSAKMELINSRMKNVENAVQSLMKETREMADSNVSKKYKGVDEKSEKRSGGKDGKNTEKIKGIKIKDDFFNLGQLTPLNAIQMMFGWNPNSSMVKLIKDMLDGDNKAKQFILESDAIFSDFEKKHAKWLERSDGYGKNAIWYDFEIDEIKKNESTGINYRTGKKIKVSMTPMQRVQLYIESQYEDNMRHMQEGGRTFANREAYLNKNKKDAFVGQNALLLDAEEINKITADMSTEEKELADILTEYYNGYAKEKINQVSLLLRGYEMANRCYAPMVVNDDYLQYNFGFMFLESDAQSKIKPREFLANKPTLNESAMTLFNMRRDAAARFVGLAIPTQNLDLVLNTVLTDEQHKGKTVRAVMEETLGTTAVDYIINFRNEMQSGKVKQDDTNIVERFTNKAFSNYNKVVFFMNFSSMFKQLGSFFMAMPYLGPINMVKGLGRKTDKKLIDKYTPQRAWRERGYATVETADLTKVKGWHNKNKAMKFAFSGGMIKFDSWTAGALWNAAENKVRSENPNVAYGGNEDAFYKLVAEEYNNAVTRSQSMADPAYRSMIGKSKSPVARALTMYKSDAMQAFNIIREAAGELRYYEKNGADIETIRQARRKMALGITGVLLNNVWAAAANLLFRGIRGKTDDYEDEEGNMTFESVMRGVGTDTLIGMFGTLSLGVEEVASFVERKIAGKNFSSSKIFEEPGLSQLSDIIMDGVDDIIKITDFTKEALSSGDIEQYLHRNMQTLRKNTKDFVITICNAAGIPLSTIERYFIEPIKNFIPEFSAAYDGWFETPDKAAVKNARESEREKTVQNIIENRGISSSEEAAKVITDLYNAGYDKVIPSDTPSTITVDGEQIKLSAAQRTKYDKAWSNTSRGCIDELLENKEFQSSSNEEKAEAIMGVFTLAGERAKKEAVPEYKMSGSAEKANSVIDAGASAAEWVLWETKTKDMSVEETFSTLRSNDFSAKVKTAIVTSVFGTAETTDSGEPSRYAKMQTILSSGANIDDFLLLYINGNVDGYIRVLDVQETVGVSISPAQFELAEKLIKGYQDQGYKAQDASTYGINAMDITERQKAVLWQIQNKSWKSKNNPFSQAIGYRVYAVLN